MLTHKHVLHLSLVVFAIFAFGCSEDDCKADGDCARGQICQSNQCSSIPCNSPSDCPEGNRTCVYGFGSCGQKECNTGDPQLDVCQAALCEPASSSCFVQCTADADCASAGNEMQCQSGLCKVRRRGVTGDAAVVPVGVDSGAIPGGGDGAGGDDTNPQTVPVGVPCAPCSGAAECTESGANAQCEALGADSYCLPSCEDGAACPDGFACNDQAGLCAPVNGSCEVCPGLPCGEGRVCNAQLGECVDAGETCDVCFGEGSCAGDGECVERDGRQVCLSPCGANDSCGSGESCVQGYCEPTSIGCDPCEGRCDQQQPICIEETGQCGECDVNNPCADGSTCGSNNRCGASCESTCVIDNDCGMCDGLPFCVEGRCVGCLQQTDCPARFSCDTTNFSCISDPCAGISCQAGSSCDAASGRCLKPDGSLGCSSAADCAADHLCNSGSGQCYAQDGYCTMGEGDSVCSPGSTCNVVNGLALLGSGPEIVCSCNTQTDRPQIACHPGLNCVQLLPDEPGGCLPPLGP